MKQTTKVGSARGKWTMAVGLSLVCTIAARADYKATVLGDNPVAYYALNPGTDGTSTSPDLSGNGNDGANFNVTPAQGPTAFVTNAVFFDGSSVAIDLSMGSNPGLLNFSGPITMEAWAQPANTTQGPANIIAKGYDSSYNNEITLRANGGNFFGASYNGPTHGASGGVQTTNWNYLVIAYDGTNWTLYVNSIPVQSNPDSTGSLNFPDPWRIGTGSGDYGTSRYFAGNISEVALYTNGLTATQVSNHYFMAEMNAAPAVSPPVIAAPPQSQTTFVGGSVTFSATVVSALPSTNQWYKGNSPLTGKTNTSLTLTGVSANDVASYKMVAGNANGTTTSASAGLTLQASGNSLKWSASGNSGVWDTANSANWINISNSQQVVFNTNDQVLFDDTVGAPTSVTVNGNVSPSVITVNSSTNSFSLNGPGTISGAGSLVKQGSSLLAVYSSGTLTGPVTISGGTVYAGNNSFHSVSSMTITNNATLDFAGGNYQTGQPVLVSGAGVGGYGALYNSYDDYPGENLAITLAGDTVFGGTNRWDLYGSITGPHKVTINWTDSADSMYGEWNGVAIDNSVGDIELAAGKLGVKSMGSTFGNPSANFIVDGGTELDFWTGDSGYAKNFHVMNGGVMQILTSFTSFSGNLTLENGAQFNAYGGSGTQTMNGTITLNGIAHLVFGDANFVFPNVISGSGGFYWDAYNHQMILQATNTYSGPTIIGDGRTVALTGNGSIAHSSLIFFGGSTATNDLLDVSGRSDQTLTLASGQTLGGIGAVNGKLIVSSSATVAPAGTNTTGANATGVIAASGNITLGGTTTLKLNGPGTNDAVGTLGSIQYGGTLNLVNISGTPLAAGNSFQVFSAAGYSGSFASVTPATPGTGLAWDKTQLNSGIIRVVSAPSGPIIGSQAIVGGNFIISGSNGVFGSNYVELTSTNVATPLTNWTPVLTNAYESGGAFHATNAINPAFRQSFYIIRNQ